jgi:hypothetical protein
MTQSDAAAAKVIEAPCISVVPLRQLRKRRILAQRLKRNLRLERRIKLLA